jgi:predicted nucleic acid-binding protein
LTDPVVVLDAGVLDRTTVDHDFRQLLHELLQRGWVPCVPTVVLAEAITGRARDATVNQVVKRLGTVDTTAATARRAGHLRAAVTRSGARRVPSGIDAIVAAHAADAGAGVVFTTDPTDLRRLLSDFAQIAVEKP